METAGGRENRTGGEGEFRVSRDAHVPRQAGRFIARETLFGLIELSIKCRTRLVERRAALTRAVRCSAARRNDAQRNDDEGYSGPRRK